MPKISQDRATLELDLLHNGVQGKTYVDRATSVTYYDHGQVSYGATSPHHGKEYTVLGIVDRAGFAPNYLALTLVVKYAGDNDQTSIYAHEHFKDRQKSVPERAIS
mgnify:CR=1 FL=1